jgi:hypothetical protein
MNVWQVATGDYGRDYSSAFLDYDVMFLGPSDGGSALENPNYYWDGKPNSALNQVWNFAHNPEPGDFVLMRYTNEVIAIGRIPEEPENQYSFQEQFRCVYGWDLCHTRRVTWSNFNIPQIIRNVFANRTQQPSFTLVHNDEVLETIKTIRNEVFDRPLKELPTIDYRIFTEVELGRELFRHGISNKNIEDILKALNQANRLLSWYWSDDNKLARMPSENEVISHLILPIFLGLGWSHQQIAVEWNKVDVAFFKKTPRFSENCVIVLEAKGLGNALGEVLEQPANYITKQSLRNVKLIVVTDGANLFVYPVNGHEGPKEPIGYFNLNNLQHKYILPKNINVVETLVNLQPFSI